MKTTAYRIDNEGWILAVTLIVLVIAGIIAAGPTLCIAPILVLLMIGLAYAMNQSSHHDLLRRAKKVSPQTSPQLNLLVHECQERLVPGELDVFVVPSRQLNAYTFGFNPPRAVVLYSSLLEVMDADELKFIVGHEMGHVALGHTWLNTLLGGMSGVPVSLGAAVVLTFAFRWWNRACEYSADRAGLLACGDPRKATTAMVKLVAREADTPAEVAMVLKALDRQDDDIGNVLAESMATHPMLIKRINAVNAYARSAEYQHILQQVSRKL
jgi:Zn-dependent protease with chaperone function